MYLLFVLCLLFVGGLKGVCLFGWVIAGCVWCCFIVDVIVYVCEADWCVWLLLFYRLVVGVECFVFVCGLFVCLGLLVCSVAVCV